MSAATDIRLRSSCKRLTSFLKRRPHLNRAHQCSACVVGVSRKVKGIDPNIADRSRSTPLHGAIANQHYETTGCLLALFPTIDPSIKNAKGETALEGTH